MYTKARQILSDPRPIRAIYPHAESGLFVGHGVSEITTHAEPGPHCDLPWIIVRFDDGREQRYNALAIHGIEYAARASTERGADAD